MPVSRGFLTFSKIVLIAVFLVILAGGVVRMTQSGMGCPDWPTCFGRIIPPTDESQLPANYKELYSFKYVDTSFNAYHTWIEWINRMLGVLFGFLLIIQFAWSLGFRKTRSRITWLCLTNLLLTGFQGWLGAKVVEANLEVAKVTTHMLVALIIAALAWQVVHECRGTKVFVADKRLRVFTILSLVLLLAQVILGTEIREQIDHISLKLNFESRELWIDQLDTYFYIHRSFSILVGTSIIFLGLKFRKYEVIRLQLVVAVSLVMLIIALGVLMNYYSVPALAQPVHLLLSSVLVIVLYSVLLKSRNKSKV